MYIKNYREIHPEPSGVEGLTVRWAINASQGANNFGMRILELEPGMTTSMHQHDNEHEIFVLVGRGELETGEQVFPVSEGSVIFVAPNEDHQFRNTGADIMRFVDVVRFPVILPK